MLFSGLIASQEGFSEPLPLISLNRGCALPSINLMSDSDSPLDDNPTLIKIVKNCFFTSIRARASPLQWLRFPPSLAALKVINFPVEFGTLK